MKNWKKTALTIGSYVAVAALAIGGTMAYLTDSEGDKNTMTVGKVDIEQLEYERVVDENGAWVSTGEVDKYGYTPDKLQEFTQDKPLYPSVYDNDQKTMIWDDRDDIGNNGASYQQSWGQIGASGSNQLFDDSVKNVLDKFVFVKNTGKSDAYVRTVFAFEAGSLSAAELDDKILHTNADTTHWSWSKFNEDTSAVIDGVKYYFLTATYIGPSSNPNGILAPGAVSYSSLLQVYLDPTTTNEICESFGDTYDILAVSQAVQTKGFDNAAEALDAAFGAVTAENNPWTSTTEVASNDALAKAISAGGNVTVASDIANAPASVEEAGTVINSDTTIDMNGNEYKYDLSALNQDDLDGAGISAFTVVNGATLTLTDANIVSDGYGVYAKGGNLVINGGSYVVGNTTAVQCNGGNVTIEGGFFQTTNTSKYGADFLINFIDNSGGSIVIKGGTFVNFNPADNVAENPTESFVADGYTVISEVQTNGDIWYTVEAE